MAALTMRIKKAASDARPASPRSSERNAGRRALRRTAQAPGRTPRQSTARRCCGKAHACPLAEAQGRLGETLNTRLSQASHTTKTRGFELRRLSRHGRRKRAVRSVPAAVAKPSLERRTREGAANERGCRRPDQNVRSGERAVAVLVFLAGAAGAGLVAADLAPGRRVVRVAVFGGDDGVRSWRTRRAVSPPSKSSSPVVPSMWRAEHVGRFRRRRLRRPGGPVRRASAAR